MAKKRMEPVDERFGIEDVVKGITALRKEIRQLKDGLLIGNKVVYTNQDMMDMFGIGVKTLKKWRDSGDLGFSLKGNTYSYSRKDVEEFLSANHFKLYDDERPLRSVAQETGI